MHNCKILGQIEFIPDTTINSIISLCDISSSFLFNSDLDTNAIIRDGELDFFKEEQPFVLFLNSSKTEYLLAIIHEGTWDFYFSEFKVGVISNGILQKINIPHIVTQYQNFHTENNIHIGMPVETLEKLKGMKYIRTGNKIKYCHNSLDSEFMEYGECEYYFECELINNKISKFRFGYTPI